MSDVVLQLPYPPSTNHMWRTPRSGPLAGRTLLSEEGRAYRHAVRACVGPRKTLHGRLRVSIEVQMPDKRRRDLDNLPKAILDSLTHAGVWLDDSQIDDLRVWRSHLMGGRIVVTIEELASAQMEIAA